MLQLCDPLNLWSPMTDLPAREKQRLAALAEYDLMDTSREAAFPRLRRQVGNAHTHGLVRHGIHFGCSN